MSDIVYRLADYLADSGFGTMGADIFGGQMPADTHGIYLMRAGGTMANYTPIEEAVIDIYSQHIESAKAVEKIEQIKRFIHRMHNTDTGNVYIYTLLVLGDVEDLSRDLEYMKIYKLSVLVTYRDKALIS